MRRISMIFAVMLTMLVGQSANSQTKTEINVVDMTITRDGKVIGKPRFVMEVGSTAMMMAEVPGGYSVKAALTRAEDGSARARRLAVDLLFEDKGQWLPVGKPSIITRLGERSSVNINLPNRPAAIIEIQIKDNWDGRTAAASYGKNKCTDARMAAWERAMKSPLASGFNKVVLQNPELPPTG